MMLFMLALVGLLQSATSAHREADETSLVQIKSTVQSERKSDIDPKLRDALEQVVSKFTSAASGATPVQPTMATLPIYSQRASQPQQRPQQAPIQLTSMDSVLEQDTAENAWSRFQQYKQNREPDEKPKWANLVEGLLSKGSTMQKYAKQQLPASAFGIDAWDGGGAGVGLLNGMNGSPDFAAELLSQAKAGTAGLGVPAPGTAELLSSKAPHMQIYPGFEGLDASFAAGAAFDESQAKMQALNIADNAFAGVEERTEDEVQSDQEAETFFKAAHRDADDASKRLLQLSKMDENTQFYGQ